MHSFFPLPCIDLFFELMYRRDCNTGWIPLDRAGRLTQSQHILHIPIIYIEREKRERRERDESDSSLHWTR